MKLLVFSHFTDKLKKNHDLRPPSTEMIERTILSAHSFTGMKPQGGILFHDDDWVPKTEQQLEYSKRMKRIADGFGMQFMQPTKRLGYRGAFLQVSDRLRGTNDNYYFWLEHDWWMTTPVEIERAMDMLDRPDCHYIKLANYHDETERFQNPKHPCPHFSFDFDRRVREPGKFMRDSLWSTNPHFGKTSRLFEYADLLRANHFKDTHLNGGAAGIEEVLVISYFRDIEKLGFEEAHKKWGVYLMLNGGTFRRMVEHVGI